MESPSALRAICQAGKDQAPPWYRIHRRPSIYLTWLFLHTPVTANQVSLLMMLVGSTGAALLSSAQLRLNLIGFCLLYLAFLLDKADGEIARYRRGESLRGMLLDRIYHRLVEPSVFLAVASREYQMTSSVGVLIAGLVMILLSNIIEENKNLSPRIFFKFLREVGRLPERPVRTASPGGRRALRALNALKASRAFIVILPLLALVYAVEWATGWPVTTYYLYGSVAALSVHLAFQCYSQFTFRLEEEIASMRELLFGWAGRSARVGSAAERSEDGDGAIASAEGRAPVEAFGVSEVRRRSTDGC